MVLIDRYDILLYLFQNEKPMDQKIFHGRQVIFMEVMRDCLEYYSWEVSGITDEEKNLLLQASDFLHFFKGIDPSLLPKRKIDGSLLLSDLDLIREDNQYFEQEGSY